MSLETCDHWYFIDPTTRAQNGPVDVATLKSLVAEGKFTSEFFSWCQFLPSWQPAKDVPYLVGLIAANKPATVTPPPPPPPSLAPAPHSSASAPRSPAADNSLSESSNSSGGMSLMDELIAAKQTKLRKAPTAPSEEVQSAKPASNSPMTMHEQLAAKLKKRSEEQGSDDGPAGEQRPRADAKPIPVKPMSMQDQLEAKLKKRNEEAAGAEAPFAETSRIKPQLSAPSSQILKSAPSVPAVPSVPVAPAPVATTSRAPLSAPASAPMIPAALSPSPAPVESVISAQPSLKERLILAQEAKKAKANGAVDNTSAAHVDMSQFLMKRMNPIEENSGQLPPTAEVPRPAAPTSAPRPQHPASTPSSPASPTANSMSPLAQSVAPRSQPQSTTSMAPSIPPPSTAAPSTDSFSVPRAQPPTVTTIPPPHTAVPSSAPGAPRAQPPTTTAASQSAPAQPLAVPPRPQPEPTPSTPPQSAPSPTALPPRPQQQPMPSTQPQSAPPSPTEVPRQIAPAISSANQSVPASSQAVPPAAQKAFRRTSDAARQSLSASMRGVSPLLAARNHGADAPSDDDKSRVGTTLNKDSPIAGALHLKDGNEVMKFIQSILAARFQQYQQTVFPAIDLVRFISDLEKTAFGGLGEEHIISMIFTHVHQKRERLSSLPDSDFLSDIEKYEVAKKINEEKLEELDDYVAQVVEQGIVLLQQLDCDSQIAQLEILRSKWEAELEANMLRFEDHENIHSSRSMTVFYLSMVLTLCELFIGYRFVLGCAGKNRSQFKAKYQSDPLMSSLLKKGIVIGDERLSLVPNKKNLEAYCATIIEGLKSYLTSIAQGFPKLKEELNKSSELAIFAASVQDLSDSVSRSICLRFEEQIRFLKSRSVLELSTFVLRIVQQAVYHGAGGAFESNQGNLPNVMILWMQDDQIEVHKGSGFLGMKKKKLATMDQNGVQWNEIGVFQKSGVKYEDVNGTMRYCHSGISKSKPEKYGYRLGTAAESRFLQMTEGTKREAPHLLLERLKKSYAGWGYEYGALDGKKTGDESINRFINSSQGQNESTKDNDPNADLTKADLNGTKSLEFLKNNQRSPSAHASDDDDADISLSKGGVQSESAWKNELEGQLLNLQRHIRTLEMEQQKLQSTVQMLLQRLGS